MTAASRDHIDRSEVVVLDDAAVPVGTADKLAAHRPPGTPHLAFSVVLFDRQGRVLLQRRASSKHHFRRRWSNACCSHPRPGERIAAAARRRTAEELGTAVDEVTVLGAFWYRASDAATNLVEHEYDVVVSARAHAALRPDPTEVEEVAWVSLGEAAGIAQTAEASPWLANVLEVVAAPTHAVAPAIRL